jgi:hypothetical protein
MEDTEWFGPISRIEIVEQSDGLLFRVIQIKRRGHLALGILVTVVFGVLFAWQESWLFFFALGLGLVWIGAWCFDDHWGEIQVDGNYLTTRGKKPVRLGWGEIYGLEYRMGGEDDPTGFYVRLGRWKWSCVMANLDREQTEEIIAAIHRRFPQLRMADELEPLSNRFRSWFGRLSGSKDDF